MSSNPPVLEAAEETFRRQSRFEVVAPIGRGANGAVYRARDRETGQEVALKTILSPDAEQTYHLKAEFRSLAQISHLNLVQLEELFVTADTCFFTMELLQGHTFATLLSPTSRDEPRAWSERGLARLRGVLSQLVSGISALHTAGKLHRDIKPSNIIVTDDGRAVLVDFGLCTELRLVERARHHLVGTLVYMPPEQAWGKPLTPAADWYALGAVLYEALVGRAPFEGVGSRLLFEKERPPALAPVTPQAASALAELAVALLDPDPARRPGPEAILEALGEEPPSPRSREATPSTPRPAPFVGREVEMTVLAAALDDLAEGRPAVVDVEGPSGIGKTELVERFLSQMAAHENTVVLRGRCHPQESVSYNGFDAVIDDLSEWLRNLEESAIAELLPDDVGALLALFPVLGRIPCVARSRDPEPGEPYTLRQRAFRALRQLLSKMGDRYTVAVAIDDLQWGGADTASLLSEVFRPPHTPRLLLVLAYRSEEQTSSTLLGVLHERAGDLLDSVHRISLGPMARAASCELAAHLLGDGSPELRSAGERIADEARGHPLYLRELALAATAMATLSEAPPPAPPDLASLLRQRIDRLDGDERRIVELASAGGRPVLRRVVLAAAGPGERGRHLVSRLTRKRLLRETVLAGEPALEPYHSHVRDAVLGSFADSERVSCHRSLADTLLRDDEPDVDSLVDHLLGAGDLAAAGRYAEAAAEGADRALAFDRAVHLYRLAVRLERGRARSDLRARLAEALTNIGRSREAAEAYAAAAADAAIDAPARRADLARRCAEQYLRAGELDEGFARLRRVLADASVPYPPSPTAAIATMVAFRTRLAVRGLDLRPRPEEARSPARLARADACWSAGLGHAWIDPIRAAAFQSRYMMLALDTGEPTRVARGLATEASQLAATGGEARIRRARDIMGRAMDMTDAGGDRDARAFALLMDGSVEFYASRWREALSLCARAESILSARRSRSEWELMTSHALSLASLAYLGELRTLRARQVALLDDARERGNRLAAICLASGVANIRWLAADDPDEAERRADDSLRPWRGDDFRFPQYLDLLARVNISLYRGDARAAWHLVAGQWPRVKMSMTLQVQNFRVTLRHLRARCALALASATGVGAPSRPEREALLFVARRDARLIAREDVVWASPLALSLEGGLAGAASNIGGALGHLEAAADAYRSVDMPLHAAAADHERSRLLGGEAGRALMRRAEAWMIDEQVARTERLAAMLVPGVSGGR
jgi:eukaryotic-like serine/threonine-protein kinase